MTGHEKFDLGFGKKVRLAWLELSLRLAAAGATFEEARPEMVAAIAPTNPGTDAQRKVMNGLKRVWFTPPDYCRATRDAGLELFRQGGASNSIFLHWGMAIAAFPFIGVVAEAIGRLLRVQGSASIADIKRRVGEKFGDRDFVQRIVRYNLSSFVDWGVIVPAKRKGDYNRGAPIKTIDPTHAAWLIEALLHSRTEPSLAIAQLRQHPALFPFEVGDVVSGYGIEKTNPRLLASRQSFSEEVVSLRPPLLNPVGVQ